MISIYFANNNSLSPDAYNGDAYMVAGTTLCASLLSAILAIALMRKLSQTMQIIQEKTHATGGSLRMLKVRFMNLDHFLYYHASIFFLVEPW